MISAALNEDTYLLIMIHHLERILLVGIEWYNVWYSYKAKLEAFVVGDDLGRVKCSIILTGSFQKVHKVFINNLPARQIRLMECSQSTGELNDYGPQFRLL